MRGWSYSHCRHDGNLELRCGNEERKLIPLLPKRIVLSPSGRND